MTVDELMDELENQSPNKQIGIAIDGVPHTVTLVVSHEDAVELITEVVEV